MTVVASGYDLKPNDLYETEPWAVDTLLRFFHPSLNSIVWEPAGGNHKISNTLKKNDFRNVFTSDIAEYNHPHNMTLDFLTKPDDYNPFGADAIITNPPYGKSNRLAVAFCRKALATKNVKMVAMLLTAKFDFGSSRKDLFQNNPAFIGKINLTDRISWEGNGETGTEDHAWYLWNKDNPTPFEPRLYYGGRNR